jgi:hypothetical protein
MMHKLVCKLTVVRVVMFDPVLPFLQRLPAVSYVISPRLLFSIIEESF